RGRWIDHAAGHVAPQIHRLLPLEGNEEPGGDQVGEWRARRREVVRPHEGDGLRLPDVLAEPLPGVRHHVLRAGGAEVDLTGQEALPYEPAGRHSVHVEVARG